MSFIEAVVYINLDYRKDRKKDIEKVLSIFPSEKVKRFSAIKHTPGTIGCTKSHIAVLEMAIEQNWKNVLVVEDDMVWNNNFTEQMKILEEKVKNPYDVIVLSGMNYNYDKASLKLFSCTSTGAYLVNNHYYKPLLFNFKEGLMNLKIYHRITEQYNIDLYWQHLHKKDNWYIVQMMYSPEGYSDVLGMIIDYKINYTEKIQFSTKNLKLKFNR